MAGCNVLEHANTWHSDKLFNVVLGGDTTNDDEKMHAFDCNGDTAIGHIWAGGYQQMYTHC